MSAHFAEPWEGQNKRLEESTHGGELPGWKATFSPPTPRQRLLNSRLTCFLREDSVTCVIVRHVYCLRV